MAPGARVGVAPVTDSRNSSTPRRAGYISNSNSALPRRLIGPLVLYDESTRPDFIKADWESDLAAYRPVGTRAWSSENQLRTTWICRNSTAEPRCTTRC